MPVASLAALLCCYLAAPLHTEGTAFVDAAGRKVTLRGVNTPGDAKIPPFRPLQSPSALEPLGGLGFNVIRLLFTWEAFEPSPGNYAADYLDYIERVADWAWAQNIYTIIDFHQDALSRQLLSGCGEGFPSWVLPPYVRLSRPTNGPECSRWYARMWFDADLWRTWRALFGDEHGMRRNYAAMARAAATRFAHHPGVIGYDLINEPLGDEKRELLPFYETVGAAVRSAHKNAILFIEPHVQAGIGLPSHLPRPQLANISYAPHFYAPLTTVTGRYLGQSFKGPFGIMHAHAAQLQAPLFVGEFGSGADTAGAAGYIRALYDRFDDGFLSGAQWSYTPNWSAERKDGWNAEDLSIVDASLALRGNYAPRPYAQAIAGEPLQQKAIWRGEYFGFELSWLHAPAKGSTDIFVPAATWHAAKLATYGEGLDCKQAGPHYLRCWAASGGVKRVAFLDAP